MQQDGRFLNPAQEAIQTCQQAIAETQEGIPGICFYSKQLQLPPQALFPPEIQPVISPAIRLPGGTEIIVLAESEIFTAGLPVQQGQLPAQQFLPIRFAIPVGKSFQHDKVYTRCDWPGNPDRGCIEQQG